MNIFEEQIIFTGKPEPIFIEFRDDAGELTDALNPKIFIYGPDRATVVNNQNMLRQSTGIFYYVFTATGTQQGYYYAMFFGDIGGLTRSNDVPKPLYVTVLPNYWGMEHQFLRSVRRAIGDSDPSNYHIGDKELVYYIQDAVRECEAKFPMGYTVEANPTGLTFNKELTVVAETYFRWKTAVLVLESVINSHIYDVGIIDAGDIRINKSGHLGTKLQFLKEQKKKIDDFLYDLTTGNASGIEIITFGQGYITGWWN
jgi:hypothetical protein